jgi:hypothetical protein
MKYFYLIATLQVSVSATVPAEEQISAFVFTFGYSFSIG